MKRILSLIIAFSMMVSATVVLADDAATEEVVHTYDAEAYADAQNLMHSLVEGDIFGTDPVAEVTRAQFVAGTCAIFGIPAISTAPGYADVTAENPYAGFIAAANAAGWIADADNFNPDASITLAQAAKILLTAAEYNAMADAKGGFPAGYLTVGNSIDLFDYVDTANAEKVTVADASIMFYNLMLAPVFEVTSYGDDMGYERGGKNYLQKLYDAYPVEGIVTATEHSSLLYNVELIVDSNTVAIDGIEYKYPDAGMELLGKSVIAYVDNSSKATGSKEIFCIIEDENEELVITAADYIETNGNQLVYDKDGKDTKVRLDGAYKVIYNGRRVADNIADSMLYDDFATIRLLNADGDAAYEVVFVDAYTYLRVANVDYISGYVSFEDKTGRQSYVVESAPGVEDEYARNNSNKFINLNGDKDVLCTIYNAEGQEVELFEVTNNIIVGLKSSADHLIHELVMCPEETVSGVVNVYDEENGIITIDETPYVMSKDFVRVNFTNDQLIKLGDTITAYVGLNGELVYLADTESEYVYGLITNAKIEDNMDKNLIIEMCTQEGFVVFNAAEKVSYDSEPKTNSMDTIMSAISGAMSDGKAVVKYSVNKDGEITHLDFAEDESGNTDYDPTKSTAAYDSLTKVLAGKPGTYRPGVSGLVSTVVLSEATVIVDRGADEDKEDRYLYTSSGSFENNYSYTVDIYDMDENGYAGFAYVTSGPTDSSKSTSLKTYIIEKCSVGIADDYRGYNLTCYGNGSYGTYFLPEESLKEGTYKAIVDGAEETVTGKRQPKPGDLIRFTIESGNIIDEYYVDFYCETSLGDADTKMYKKIIGNGEGGQFVNNAKSLPTDVSYSGIAFTNGGYSDTMMRDLNGSSAAGYVTGYVYNSERTMVLCNGIDSGSYAFSSFRPYVLPSTVVLFDTQARKVTVTPYMASAVKTYKANPGDEDFVVLRNNTGKPEIAFIYR